MWIDVHLLQLDVVTGYLLCTQCGLSSVFCHNWHIAFEFSAAVAKLIFFKQVFVHVLIISWFSCIAIINNHIWIGWMHIWMALVNTRPLCLQLTHTCGGLNPNRTTFNREWCLMLLHNLRQNLGNWYKRLVLHWKHMDIQRWQMPWEQIQAVLLLFPCLELLLLCLQPILLHQISLQLQQSLLQLVLLLQGL